MSKKKKDPALLRTVDELMENYNPEQRKLFGEMFYQTIKQATEVAARQAAEQAAIVIENEHREYRSKRFRKQYANTRLLLQHYRSLNSHYANAVWESQNDVADEFLDIMELMSGHGYNETIVVETIKKSSEKTRIIMQHVNKMLDIYHKQCENSKYTEDIRHWRVIKELYLLPEKVSVDDIAERENINRRTVYKDVDAAVESLTMLLFGIDGVEKLCE